ncbi:EAL domain-containing protein [Herbaspirillum sp. C7C2]|uniref:putative bifunctional diguanylate cyclase/phosphodiesterase n=1 Tax=Herbaspirillum sp. C7C2 TaxID=2736666 RepID=UPI001F522B9A|nr:EAL domain-containing protein [Herbaspirillum sp. C7C2]MCI1015982.1 EAL domain-containing protein [Herbaspirillum sp. C7C2]
MNKKLNSLGVYIAIAMLVALCLPVVLALTVLNGVREKQIGIEMQALVNEKAQTMQHSLVLPVWSLDKSDINAVLQGAMLDPQVVSAEITDPDEKIIARVEDGQRRLGNIISRSVPLVMQQNHQNVSLGSLQLIVSDYQLQRKLAADKSFHTLVLLAQAVASLIIIGLLVYRRILRPIGMLTAATERIERGSFDERIAIPQQDEIGQLARHMESMQSSLKALFDEQAAILGNIPAGVLFVRDGSIVFVNEAAQALLGSADRNLVGQPAEEVFVEPAQQAAYVAQAVARSSGAAGEIVLLRRGDGGSFPAELHTSLIDPARPADQIWVVIDVSARLDAENRIDRLAFYDPVTQLPNKTLFMDRLRRGLARRRSNGTAGAVFVMEISRADLSYGGASSEEIEQLLVECARRFSGCVTPEQTVARLEGAKFALGSEIRTQDLAECLRFCETLAHRIIATFTDPHALAAARFPCAVNLGINIVHDDHHGAAELLMQAELAMVQSRLAGRNTFRFFDPAMQALANQRSLLEAELRQAVAQRQFIVYYQPQVTYEGEVVGAEALLRWKHPEKGVVAPGGFISVAEDMGLMEQIGQQALHAICADLQAWQRQGLAHELVVAVNVSAQEFKVDNFVGRFREIIGKYRLHSHALKVELTESMMVDHVEDVIAKMQMLRSSDISISLDDFGTGYSSLSYLGRFPIDQIKIDQSFVREMEKDAAMASIVRSIIMLGQSLNLSILAEGVETQQQRDLLHAQGCSLYQGYWYGKPMPGEQFVELLTTPDRFR